MNPASLTPSIVTVNLQNETSSLPGVRKQFSTAVIINRMNTAFNPFNMKDTGTCDNMIIDIRNTVATIYPVKLWNRNSEII